MRRLFAALGLLLAGLYCIAHDSNDHPVKAQFGACQPGFCQTIVSSGFSPSCSQSSAWLARATNVTLTADKRNYDTMICGMVTDGDWANLDVLYIFAAPDSTTAALSLVSSTFNGTTSGTPGAFNAYQGWTGSNSGSFQVDVGPANGFTNYKQNSAGFGLYDRSSRTSTNNFAEAGEFAGNVDMLLQVKAAAGLAYDVTANNFNNSGITNANAQGQYVALRTGSTATAVYKNGSGTPLSSNSSDTSASLGSTHILVFNAGTCSCATNDQLAAFWMGNGSVGPTTITARINTYLTAYGNNVY